MAAPLVSMRGITKRFGPVTVLRDVNFDLFPGEVHVLAGENGAGKSTLVKILAGVYSDYQGSIEIGGSVVRPSSPIEANALGVAVIYQELSLVPSMTVADNIFLGRFIERGGFVANRAQQREAGRLLEQLGIDVDPATLVGDLPIAAQQLIEVAKALGRDARVIVMDEPTSALGAVEVERLFALIAGLKARGCGIVYITHKMEEIGRIADRITVLRDGSRVVTAPAAELPVSRIILWMVGREIEDQFPRHTPQPGDVRLRVERFTVQSPVAGRRPLVEDVSFSVRAGEVLGIAGLQGSGSTELLMGIFGAYGHRSSGEVWLNGESVRIRAPRDAIGCGVALLTNDRKANGLVLSMPVVENVVLADLDRLAPGGWRKARRERECAARLGESLRLHAATLDMEAGELSGGNQQKVALAKWLQTDPQVMLLDEPTRGIDVGAKRDIYQLMNEWTQRGIAIVLISGDLPELLALSDRILVMHRGRVTALFDRAEATPHAVLEAAMGRETRA